MVFRPLRHNIRSKKLGYIEVLRKGYAKARNETVRVIFDPEITAEEEGDYVVTYGEDEYIIKTADDLYDLVLLLEENSES